MSECGDSKAVGQYFSGTRKELSTPNSISRKMILKNKIKIFSDKGKPREFDISKFTFKEWLKYIL